MNGGWQTCALCPRLCRVVCPVATGSGREASTPTAIAAVMLEVERQGLPRSLAEQALSLCVDCGACEEHCHVEQPFAAMIKEAQLQWFQPPDVQPLGLVAGQAPLVAVESDERPLASLLSEVLKKPVARLKTSDALGEALVGRAGFVERAAQIRERLENREVVVAHGGVAAVLEAAGVAFSWLHEMTGLSAEQGSCRCKQAPMGLACCGGAGLLPVHHPSDARRVAEMWTQRGVGGVCVDARCRNHIQSVGLEATDIIDVLMQQTEAVKVDGKQL